MKIVYIMVGCISVALGAIGSFLPILPTTPFLLLAAFCFARGSERLNNWFVGTKLYQKHLDSFVKRRAMDIKTKLTIILTVTALMTVGFIMMKQVLIGRIILFIVWVSHILYFVFLVKTEPVSIKEDNT